MGIFPFSDLCFGELFSFHNSLNLMFINRFLNCPIIWEGYKIREGTITISMIDTRTDKTVWQGWTTDEVNSRNLTSKEIQNSVKSIFKKFDIAKN